MALFGSALFLVLFSWLVSVTSDLEIITARPGDDVTLICRNENTNQIYLLEWTKPNLKREETVFLYRNDGILLDQHESFKNRVFLKDPQMKDGDLSVVLKDVNIEDSGTYQCRVLQENGSQRKWSLISTINLQVSPPGEDGGEKDEGGVKDGENKDGVKEEEKGTSQGVLVGIVLLGLLLTVLVLVAICVIY